MGSELEDQASHCWGRAGAGGVASSLKAACPARPSPAWDVLFIAAQAALTATRQLPGRTFLGRSKAFGPSFQCAGPATEGFQGCSGSPSLTVNPTRIDISWLPRISVTGRRAVLKGKRGPRAASPEGETEANSSYRKGFRQTWRPWQHRIPSQPFL